MTSADDALYGPDQGGAEDESQGLRARLANQAEDAIGKLADDLLENPVFNSALTSAFAARDKMAQAQQSAMGALNIPSASDLDKVSRTLRSISHRLEDVEDAVEQLGVKLDQVAETAQSVRGMDEHLSRIESRIDQLTRELESLRREQAATGSLAGEPPAVVPEG
jgi:chromosome segregation ATPase